MYIIIYNINMYDGTLTYSNYNIYESDYIKLKAGGMMSKVNEGPGVWNLVKRACLHEHSNSIIIGSSSFIIILCCLENW